MVIQIEKKDYNFLLSCPPIRRSEFKRLYDERLYILDKVLKYFVYPGFDEVSLHENKRYLSFWLEANQLPHPKTDVFYRFSDAQNFINFTSFPIVSKMNIGASGAGVKILKSQKEALDYIDSAFSKDGIKQYWGPNIKMGGFSKRIFRVLNNPSLIKKRIDSYKVNYNERQKDFVIFQQFVDHDYEWRVVRIGNSYFGHKKIKMGEKASGSKGINYDTPPTELLDFVKGICEQHNFNTMAIDLFNNEKGGYYINEMQCIFGHVQSYICEKDGQPGRFVFMNNKWVFEEGLFNTNLSYDLRLENALEIYNS